MTTYEDELKRQAKMAGLSVPMWRTLVYLDRHTDENGWISVHLGMSMTASAIGLARSADHGGKYNLVWAGPDTKKGTTWTINPKGHDLVERVLNEYRERIAAERSEGQ